jgi:hypothetical protein
MWKWKGIRAIYKPAKVKPAAEDALAGAEPPLVEA